MMMRVKGAVDVTTLRRERSLPFATLIDEAIKDIDLYEKRDEPPDGT
jgi:hypothetical protein